MLATVQLRRGYKTIKETANNPPLILERLNSTYLTSLYPHIKQNIKRTHRTLVLTVISITKENTQACHISNTQRTTQQSLVTAWFPSFFGNKLFLQTFHLRVIELNVLRLQDAVVVLFQFVRENVAVSGKGSSSFAVITCVCVPKGSGNSCVPFCTAVPVIFM